MLQGQLTLEQQQEVYDLYHRRPVGYWPVRRLVDHYNVSEQTILAALNSEQARRSCEAEAQQQTKQPWLDPALDGYWRPRALTLEQQQTIYDTYYDLVHPQSAGYPPPNVQTSMNQLAKEYRVSPQTVRAAIEWEQIRRINHKAGPNKLAQQGQPDQDGEHS